MTILYNYKHYFVYLIWNKINRKMYIGYKSTNKDPYNVIGKTYFSSSSNKEFIKDQKDNPNNYRYKVLADFKTSEEALELEISLHEKYNVDINDRFYNLSKQRKNGFTTTNCKGLCGPENGMFGRKRTEEEKKLISEKTKEGMRRNSITREKMSETSKAFWKTHEHLKSIYAERTSKQFKELWTDQEYIDKMKNRTVKPYVRTDNQKEFISNLRKEEAKNGTGAHKKLTCPHCGKITNTGNYAQYHGDRCKNKDLQDLDPVLIG